MAAYQQLGNHHRNRGSAETLTSPPPEEWHKLPISETEGKGHARKALAIVRYLFLHVVVPFLVVIAAFKISAHQLRKHEEFEMEKSYGSDVRFMSLDKKYDHVWADDMRDNIYPLPKDGSLGPEVEVAVAQGIKYGSIAMFHSLHCLAMMRMTLQKAHYGTRPGLDYHDDDHWPHCFHHLRKALLCQADDVIELPKWNNGSLGAPLVSGVADIRHCRSSDKLYALRNRLLALEE